MVDAPVGGLERQPTGRRPGDHGVEAPTFVVDLDDVARLDALDPHVDRQLQHERARRELAGARWTHVGHRTRAGVG